MLRRATQLSASPSLLRPSARLLVVVTVVSCWTPARVAVARPEADAKAAAATASGAALATTATAAAPVSEWEEAVNAFKYQDFDTAIPRLRKLIYPAPRLERKREWLAREYLAAALWWSGKKQPALDEFTALLVRNPPALLDPAYYPPQMIKDFAQLRENLIRLGVIKRNQKAQIPDEPGRPQSPALVLALFPFGVGQFANQQPLKGALFLGTELGLATASAALYVFNRDLGVQGRSQASTRAWQLSTGGVFWAVAAWGIVDAVLQRRALAAELARSARRIVR